MQTMFGVLCIYLLIGLALRVHLRGHRRGRRRAVLRPGTTTARTSDYLYFSFSTHDHHRLRRPHRRHRPRALVRDHRAADRPDLPRHRRRRDRRQPPPGARRPAAPTDGRCRGAAGRRPADAAAIARIHAEGIEDRVATFETSPPGRGRVARAASRAGRCARGGARWRRSSASPRWARTPTRRPTTSGVGEATLYVAREARGEGVGPSPAGGAGRRGGAPRLLEAGRRRSSPRTRPASRWCAPAGWREVGVHRRHGRLDGRVEGRGGGRAAAGRTPRAEARSAPAARRAQTPSSARWGVRRRGRGDRRGRRWAREETRARRRAGRVGGSPRNARDPTRPRLTEHRRPAPRRPHRRQPDRRSWRRAKRRRDRGRDRVSRPGVEQARARAGLGASRRRPRRGGQPPLLVATDQEGGIVKRFPDGPPQRSPYELGRRRRRRRAGSRARRRATSSRGSGSTPTSRRCSTCPRPATR